MRWSEEERGKLSEMKYLLQDSLKSVPHFPEVVGERRMLRFLRGQCMDVENAVSQYKKFLEYRKKNNVDDIRQQIVYGGLNCPSKFPKGELILSLFPQVVINPSAVDLDGNALVVEKFCFHPHEIFAQISLDDYLLFTIYCLEFRALILEQMSHEQEKGVLEKKKHTSIVSAVVKNDKPYGVITKTFVLRDFKGLGVEHVGVKGQNIVKSVLSLVSGNYSEFLTMAFMINTPWMFNIIWQFLRQILDSRTIKKVHISGSKYLEDLQEHLSLENIPIYLGGTCDDTAVNFTPYAFDVEGVAGCLRYPGAPSHQWNVGPNKDTGRQYRNRSDSTLSMDETEDATGNLVSGKQNSIGANKCANESDDPVTVTATRGDGIDCWNHWNVQPIPSKLSLMYRSGIYKLLEIYVDPIIYYCMKYKHRAIMFILTLVIPCWRSRNVISAFVVPLVIYLLCTLI